MSEAGLKSALREVLSGILTANKPVEIDLDRKSDAPPLVILVVGVNGVGKTTTIAKLSQQFKARGARVLLGACDTFRAAATEQLQIWANRVGVELVSGNENEKPRTVAYRAVHQARNEHYDVLIIDTAGRLHTRTNLMHELGSIVEIINREQPGAPDEVLLVVDAATGQNALQQAREFNELVHLTGIVVTKLDGTQKGGIVVAIKDELGIPIRYIGVGEGIEDLRPFSATEFIDALLLEDESDERPGETRDRPFESGRIRRKRREPIAENH